MIGAFERKYGELCFGNYSEAVYITRVDPFRTAWIAYQIFGSWLSDHGTWKDDAVEELVAHTKALSRVLTKWTLFFF